MIFGGLECYEKLLVRHPPFILLQLESLTVRMISHNVRLSSIEVCRGSRPIMWRDPKTLTRPLVGSE